MAMMEEGPVPTFKVKECYAGTITNPPGQLYGPRPQRELQLVLLHTGSMFLDIDGQVTEVLPGHVVLLMPDTMIRIAFSEKTETWHRWITIHSYEIEEDVLVQLARLPGILPISERMNQLVDILVGLQQQDFPDSTVRHTLALGAFQLYAEECGKHFASNVHPAVSLTKSFIKERFREELSLAELANAALVSTGHLLRLFRQHESLTPMQYLWNYRVLRGVELLRTTGLPIGEVAERCGFKTSYHFARMIKSTVGLTPTEIQKNEKSFSPEGVFTA
ncbi:helix-turn-helix transcriptional regulator [Cohnella silvisoli]|uniref:AraC family transcriptional regulator n=1 Tax=Cohnella silvisoli TaxID=2873699 RepID=A0ABV1L035_9BACL|nr:AraC family transcriptional regulator [Cohnella silvisoli]MCD9024924.1 AraC family transcriptional regulator [Cohnella silvisoli]